MLSSGVFITQHECCHLHHHAKTDHKHCHETKILVKIQDEFIKSKTGCFSFVFAQPLLFTFQSTIIFSEILTPHFQNRIPPLILLTGVNFINFTSQRVFYC